MRRGDGRAALLTTDQHGNESMRRSAAEVRAQLDHPVIDSDGHLLEPTALLHDYLTALVGTNTARRILLRAGRQVSMGNSSTRHPRTGWWLTPSNARDIATAMAPALRAQRAAELGIDFNIVYPSAGLVFASLPEREFRLAGVRAVNNMNAELCREHKRSIAPSALIPMHTPEEAISELTHARDQLGFRVAVIPPIVARPIPALKEAFPQVCWMDSYGIDSAYDYDMVWETFSHLGLAVTSHGAVADCTPFGRASPSNFVFNHIGAHSFQQEHLCKSLVLAGVPKRFPELNFAFLECGAMWACDLLQALVEHFIKRGPAGLKRLDPSQTDREELARLLERYGGESFVRSIPLRTGRGSAAGTGDPQGNEFRLAQVDSADDLRRAFSRFYFGCEADDRGVAIALRSGNLFGTRLKAILGSDIGHWDVSDARDVVPESHELVECSALEPGDYQDFVFRHAVLLHGQMDPGFFAGTAVEERALDLLGREHHTRERG
jgi:predicted TIM-barrel fold metal-dependent hydrolase